MKKIATALCTLCAVAMMSSCYCSSVYVGKLHPQEKVTCVGTHHNAHFLGGLISAPKVRAKKYVGNVQDYRVKTFHSFGDYILSGITLSIYTPTTTKFYVNNDGLQKLRKQRLND